MSARSIARLLVLVAVCALRPVVAATTQDITLATPTGTLAGSLTRPDGDAEVPVVLLIAGSGPTDRDGNTVGTSIHPDSLKQLAAALADAGFAVLRYDRRGIGASAAIREEDLRIDTLADDAAAWVAQLAGDKRFTGVAIVGHSEGALVGMLATQHADVGAFVSMAGIARNLADVLRTQLTGKLPPTLVDRNEAILTALQKGERVDDVPAGLMVLYRPSVQPFLISSLRRNSAALFATLRMPSLIVQGDADVQVAVADAEALHAARPSAELLLVPGMSHTLKLVPPGPGGQRATYLDPALPLAPTFVQGVVAFLTRSLTQHPAP